MNKKIKRLSAAVITLILVLAMSASVFAAAVTKDEAAAKALADAGLAKSDAARLKTERDGKEFEVSFADKKTGDRYEYDIRITDGKIREIEVEYAHKYDPSSERISEARAVRIAAKAAGVSKNTVKKGSCRYKKDDGEWVYKLKFKRKGCIYEYEILAPTGKITEMSKKYR